MDEITVKPQPKKEKEEKSSTTDWVLPCLIIICVVSAGFLIFLVFNLITSNLELVTEILDWVRANPLTTFVATMMIIYIFYSVSKPRGRRTRWG